jgi:hypothetical protein
VRVSPEVQEAYLGSGRREDLFLSGTSDEERPS